ncbi:MAG: antibiotic biosynthesis monooxygenase [Fibrobacteres bacterium]|jgi:autoinducer 2-degrading protein|nr:antibiotic biosynthesis monooxygenase [Fibrobacterota bacterium]
MIANVVTVYVKPEHLQEFLAATRANRAGSRTEPGNLRFDILRAADDPSRFLFYEVFVSQEALEDHRRTPHYLAWRAQAENWMAKPREGRAHLVVDPLDLLEW